MNAHNHKKRKAKHRRPLPHNEKRKHSISPLQSISMERPPYNERNVLTAVPEFEHSSPSASIPRTPIGNKGMYEATLCLVIPGVTPLFHGSLALGSMAATVAESLLISASDIRVTVEHAQGGLPITFLRNSKGQIASATVQVLADDFKSARTQAYDLVLPVLSRWAFEYDMPIDVGWDAVKEIRTDTMSWTVGVQGAVKQAQIPSGRIPSKPEWRILLASFREGHNVSNPLFKLLAFYKVIEGIKRIRIHRLRESLPPGQRKSVGMSEAFSERFPNDPLEIVQGRKHAMSDSCKNVASKEYSAVIPEIETFARNAIAHIDPVKGDSLSGDQFLHVAKAEEWVPVVQYMARSLLEVELNAERQKK